jgi:hypothetical protein
MSEFSLVRKLTLFYLQNVSHLISYQVDYLTIPSPWGYALL